MKQALIRKTGMVLTLAFVLASVTPLVAVAAPPAKALEKQEAAKTRLEEKKLQICEKREDVMKRKMTKAADHGTNVIAVFDKIATRTTEFYTNKGRTVANYDDLTKAVTDAKSKATDAVAATKSATETFTCDSEDPKGVLTAFKDAVKAQNVALKEYKTAVKDLIVGVKSAQGQASSSDPEKQTDSSDSDTDTADTEKTETETNNTSTTTGGRQ